VAARVAGNPLWYGVGCVLGLMIGGALGGSFVQERGRRVLPVVIVATIVFAAVLGLGAELRDVRVLRVGFSLGGAFSNPPDFVATPLMG